MDRCSRVRRQPQRLVHADSPLASPHWAVRRRARSQDVGATRLAASEPLPDLVQPAARDPQALVCPVPPASLRTAHSERWALRRVALLGAALRRVALLGTARPGRRGPAVVRGVVVRTRARSRDQGRRTLRARGDGASRSEFDPAADAAAREVVARFVATHVGVPAPHVVVGCQGDRQIERADAYGRAVHQELAAC